MNPGKWLAAGMLTLALVMVGCGGGSADLTKEIDELATEMGANMKDPAKMVKTQEKIANLKVRIDKLPEADKKKYTQMLGEKVMSKMLGGALDLGKGLIP